MSKFWFALPLATALSASCMAPACAGSTLEVMRVPELYNQVFVQASVQSGLTGLPFLPRALYTRSIDLNVAKKEAESRGISVDTLKADYYYDERNGSFVQKGQYIAPDAKETYINEIVDQMKPTGLTLKQARSLHTLLKFKGIEVDESTLRLTTMRRKNK